MQGSGQERFVDQSQVGVEGADEGEQVEARIGPAVIGQVEHRRVDAERFDHRPELIDAGLVGPEAPTDGDRRRIDPQEVAALDRARRLDAPEDVDGVVAVEGLVQLDFGLAQRLAGTQQDGAATHHE